MFGSCRTCRIRMIRIEILRTVLAAIDISWCKVKYFSVY